MFFYILFKLLIGTNRNQKELPQTGTNSYLGAIASLVGLGVFFGVGGVKKRHEN